jgi:uncharacterized membrane protein YgcG
MYNSNPITRNAVSLRPGDFPSEVSTPIDLRTGNDHISFLNYAHRWNLKVIFPLYGDQAAIGSVSEANMQQFIRDQIDEVGWHPAIIMYTFGNELPLNSDVVLLGKVNGFINYARNYQFTKWARTIPITNAVVDLPLSYDNLFQNLDVDVFTTNNGYRGFSYSSFWDGDGGQHQGGGRLACINNKPIFVGEMGQHAYDGFVNNSDWFPKLWESTYVDSMNYSLIGGALFEYNDEPLKAASQQFMGVVRFSVNSWTEETTQYTSRTSNGWRPDIATRKTGNAAYNYDIISGISRPSSGCTISTCNVNMNTDYWTFIGRQPYSINDVIPWICTRYGTAEPTYPTYPDPPATTGIFVPPPSDSTTGSQGGTTGGADGSDGSDGGDGGDGGDGASDGGDGTESEDSPSPSPILRAMFCMIALAISIAL